MKRLSILLTSLILMVFMTASFAQEPAASITEAELRDHIFFLASDYLNGRVGISPEYELAARYVASQFAAAGLQPVVEKEDGSKSYLQGVPFLKTTYSDELKWKIINPDGENILLHKEDFKILYGNKLNHDKLEIVYAGYGIEEPDHNWNDFENIDVEGKIMICISGAPTKKGKAVLPEEVHQRYVGPRGLQSKVGALFSKGAEGLILVDIDGSSGMPFSIIPSAFDSEKYVYQGGESRQQRSMPSVYLAKPEILNTLMGNSKNNPLLKPEDMEKNYSPGLLEDTYLDSSIEILNEALVFASNVTGMVPGTDPVLKNEYIVVGAHLDHVKPVNGEVCNGADDNASGSAGVMEIAEALAMSPCKRSVVFITYTAEEMGLIGSRHFLNSELFPAEQIKFNINMDMIGRSDPDNEESRAHYVVSDKKYIAGIEKFIMGLNDGITDFPLIFDNDEDSPGGSDHQSFMSKGIPAFFFFSGVHNDLHRPGDDPEKIDYAKAEDICRLSYIITTELANMDAVPAFVIED